MRRSRPGSCPPASLRKAGGQTSVFVVVTAVAMLLSALMVYNAGRLSLQRMQLQTAADAAAYSGAVLTARSYNFSAYANRAMVANHVAVAQAVGLASWSKYYCLVYTLTNCGDFPSLGTGAAIDAALQQVPPGLPGVVPFQIYRVLSLSLYQSLDVALPPLVTAADAVVTAMSQASNAFHLATLAELGAAALGGGVLNDIVQMNQPDATISAFGLGTAAVSTAAVTAFTRRNDPTLPSGGINNHMREAVTNALDGFSIARVSTETLPFPLFSLGPCVTVAGVPGTGLALVGAVYGGTTTLLPDNRQWQAADGAVFLGLYACGAVLPPTQNSPPVPVGSVTPIIVPPSLASASAGGTTPGPFDIGASYSGLQAYWEVASSGGSLFTSKAPPVTLYVRRGGDTIPTLAQLDDSGAYPAPRGDLRMEDGMAGTEVQAGASAEAYFARPNTVGYLGVEEYGNLFNPYWEPRLIPTGLVLDAAAALAQDLLP